MKRSLGQASKALRWELRGAMAVTIGTLWDGQTLRGRNNAVIKSHRMRLRMKHTSACQKHEMRAFDAMQLIITTGEARQDRSCLSYAQGHKRLASLLEPATKYCLKQKSR
jgi:hypothetical protein